MLCFTLILGLRALSLAYPLIVPSSVASAQGSVRYASAAGRWVILAAVLGSGIAFLDSTVVNVAIPAIREDLNAGLTSVQWTIDAYLFTLSALLLTGGSLGDLYGRWLR